MKLYFVDNHKDMGLISGKEKLRKGEDKAVAINPPVRSYFKRAGIDADDTSQYFTNESHLKALERSETICDWLEEKAKFDDMGIGVNDAYRYSLIYFMRFAVHNCLLDIEVMLNAVNKYRPETISASYSGNKRVSSFYLEPEERYLGYLAQRMAGIEGLGFEDMTTSGGGKDHAADTSPALAEYLKYALKSVRFFLWEKEMIFGNALKRDRPVFYTTRNYQLGKLAGKLQEEYPDIRFILMQGPVFSPKPLPDILLPVFCGRYWRNIVRQKVYLKELVSAIASEKEAFSHRGIFFGDIIARKVEDNIGDYPLKIMQWTPALRHCVDSTKPRLIISVGNRADDVTLAEIARNLSVDDLLISHGSHVKPKDRSETVEWGEHGKMLLRGPFSHMAMQTPLSEGFLEAFPTKAAVLRTGPLIWGKKVDRKTSDSLFGSMFGARYRKGEVRIITHAGTPKPYKGLRFWIYETPDEYINAIRDLAEAVEKMQDTILIVKFRPTFQLSEDDMRALIPFSDKVVLSIDEPFLDVLGMSDLLVSFASTTIEEALQNGVPVLLYGGNGRYQHIKGFEIAAGRKIERSAVYHVRSSGDLGRAIEGICSLGIDGNGDDKGLFKGYAYQERESLKGLLKNG